MERGDAQQGVRLIDCHQTWGHRAVIAVMGSLHRGNVCSCLFRLRIKLRKEKSTCRGFLDTTQKENDQPQGGQKYSSEDQIGKVY